MCILKLIVAVYYLMFCCTVEESTSDTIMETEHPPSSMSSGTGDGDVPGMHSLLSVMAHFIYKIIFKSSKPRTVTPKQSKGTTKDLRFISFVVPIGFEALLYLDFS